jgi:chemotaxis methyl-accepting protein methylase
MEDHQFRQLLEHLGLSWRGYRKVRKGVKKRIARHMQDLGRRNMAAYLLELDRNGDVRQVCARLMTVSISRFFRDRRLWQVLKEEILRGLAEKRDEKIRVWFAGCASGEEVYSLKILWDILAASSEKLPDLDVVATDVNPLFLERAQDGIYPSSSVKELPQDLLSLYFQVKKKSFIVIPSLKNGIKWLEQDLVREHPGSAFEIIFLRNSLLTYYQDELKMIGFRKVIGALSPEGYLIIGSHEKLPFGTNELLPFESLPFVFQKGIRKEMNR